jgi:hypothetical protein
MSIENNSKILINLKIEKNNGSLHNKTLLEYIPINRLDALLKSNYLQTVDIINQLGVNYSYNNEKEQLEKYKLLFNNDLCCFEVKYYKPKHKIGRVYVSKALGLTSFRKKIRHTLMAGLYCDFDIKNAQPIILKCICQDNNISCPMLIKYCNNRNEILQELANELNITITQAKKLVLSLFLMEHW